MIDYSAKGSCLLLMRTTNLRPYPRQRSFEVILKYVIWDKYYYDYWTHSDTTIDSSDTNRIQLFVSFINLYLQCPYSLTLQVWECTEKFATNPLNLAMNLATKTVKFRANILLKVADVLLKVANFAVWFVRLAFYLSIKIKSQCNYYTKNRNYVVSETRLLRTTGICWTRTMTGPCRSILEFSQPDVEFEDVVLKLHCTPHVTHFIVLSIWDYCYGDGISTLISGGAIWARMRSLWKYVAVFIFLGNYTKYRRYLYLLLHMYSSSSSSFVLFGKFSAMRVNNT